jgi:hypothetical protein
LAIETGLFAECFQIFTKVRTNRVTMAHLVIRLAQIKQLSWEEEEGNGKKMDVVLIKIHLEKRTYNKVQWPFSTASNMYEGLPS